MSNKIPEDIKILIVEDEIELREYLKEYLNIFFINVFTAKCGVDGYEKYQSLKPDIILSDINMPNLDGLSLVKKIREQDKETDIIIMSAHSQQDKLLQAIELGLVTYLIKPIDVQKLKETLFGLAEKIKGTKKRIYFSDKIYWEKMSRTLWDDTKQIVLKDREQLFFELLCSDTAKFFTTKDIFDYIHNKNQTKEFSEYAITSFIKRLRAKLPSRLIKNEYGLGYRVVIL